MDHRKSSDGRAVFFFFVNFIGVVAVAIMVTSHNDYPLLLCEITRMAQHQLFWSRWPQVNKNEDVTVVEWINDIAACLQCVGSILLMFKIGMKWKLILFIWRRIEGWWITIMRHHGWLRWENDVDRCRTM